MVGEDDQTKPPEPVCVDKIIHGNKHRGRPSGYKNNKKRRNVYKKIMGILRGCEEEDRNGNWFG